MAAMSMRLPDEFVEQLHVLAEATGKTKNFLIIQAVR